MTLFVCWVVFPLVLVVIATGCGLLVERAAGLRLPGALVPPVGVALIIVTADFATAWSATARFAVPVVVVLAVLGYGLSYPWRGRRVEGWTAAAAVLVFAAYAAPIVLSGSATFAGYITLDDTSTWLALTDHVMTHGRALSGVAPSTYEVVLHDYLGDIGYPLGGFMLLGVGGKLTGQDVAWLFQPTMALLGAMLGLTIYAACGRLVRSKVWRAVAAVLGAQPALLFAYALWSGIKEVAAAAMVALVCAILAATAGRWKNARHMLPAALAAAALLAVLSPAGGIWLVVPLLVVVALLARRGRNAFLRGATTLTAIVAVLSVPSILIARAFITGAANGALTSSTAAANLGHPLDTLQLFGIWPATDFRNQPHDPVLTYVLIGVLVAAAAAGLLLARRRQAWAMPLYLSTGVAGAVITLGLEHVGLSSPWVDAKAMAEASPALVAAAVAGAAAVFETGRRTEATIACAAIAVGVLWSNGLAYGNAWLAPRPQLAELETIGQRFAGGGPTLMTEYQSYGVRHFLRRMDPEAASERRARVIALRAGGSLRLGQSADLDAFDLNAVVVYRTLVLRRSPVESRPPSVYRLVWQGHWYEVWQRPPDPGRILEHVSLGDPADPGAVPRCADVLAAAQVARAAGGELATVLRPAAPIVLDLSEGTHPATWYAAPDQLGTLIPQGQGSVSLDADVPRAGRYGLWLGGSFRRTVTVLVDGHDIGSVGLQLNNAGQWTPLGAVELDQGRHRVELRYAGSRLAPGSGGFPFAMGPLALSTTTADLPVTFVAPGRARALCGKRLDWIEAVRG